MNITFITTVRHNVGDDFVREGLKYLLRQYFANNKVHFTNIHKHMPVTARYGFEIIRDSKLSHKLDSEIPIWLTPDRIKSADLVVQSGAPVYWCHQEAHCFQNEWFTPLIRRRFNPQKQKLLNLAGGSCQTYFSDGSEFLKCEKDINYIREFFNLSTLTTVRDKLAKKILNSINLDAPLIPCTSIFAMDEHKIKAEKEEYVVVNFMEGGAHYTFGQNIDSTKWKNEFSRFYYTIKKKEKIVFACHNKAEVKSAKEIDDKANIFFSSNYLDYLKFYSKAKCGIMNRVHGAFVIAAFGRPILVVGNDTRARMVEEIGGRSYFVNNVDADFLLQDYDRIMNESKSFIAQFNEIKTKARSDYFNSFDTIHA